MKQLCSFLLVLCCAVTLLSAQVTLSISSAAPDVGDTFNIYVTVEGFDSLSSAQFRLKWDPTIIKLIDAEVPVDTITNNSPFQNNPEPDRISFLYYNSNGVGNDGSLADESTLLQISFVAIGDTGDSTCIIVDSSGALEFVKLASEELSVMVLTGCVHLQGVNFIPSHEQQNLKCYWQSNERLIISHAPQPRPAILQVFSLDGRKLKESIIAPNTTSTSLFANTDWQRSILLVRYSFDGQSQTRLIAGPR